MASKYAANPTLPAAGAEQAPGNKSGCYVQTVHGFILVLLAVAIAVGVGIVVHLAGGKTFVCQCGDDTGVSSSTTQAFEQRCIDTVTGGSGQAICKHKLMV